MNNKKNLEFLSEEQIRSLNSTHDNLMLMTSSFGPINHNVQMFKPDSGTYQDMNGPGSSLKSMADNHANYYYSNQVEDSGDKAQNDL